MNRIKAALFNVQEWALGAQLDIEGDDLRLLNELLGVSAESQG